MTDRELMRMALDALEKLNKDGWILADFEDEVYASIEALRARLAQPEREWQDLTDDESDEIWGECLGVFDCLKMTQAKLKEKNSA